MNSELFPPSAGQDILCFSHLRWDFVYQRPQHLLSRFAKAGRVFFIEEPIFEEGEAGFEISQREDGLSVVVPKLPHGLSEGEINNALRSLLDELIEENNLTEFVAWYYTPMMMAWTDHLSASAVVYDCMDELSAFKNAPAELRRNEAELFRKADLVFTGGRSLYEAKRNQHASVYCFPSSIDVAHFARAMSVKVEPEDQRGIPSPRIGFFGVIDERCDIDLLRQMAEARKDWHFIMLGPVVKISDEDLPRGSNIHYLGGKDYKELPDYISGWDVAIMPFAMNESTKFISPTKTPEYLAAGRPVVSTPITDVVTPYGDEGLVRIAAEPDEFVAAIAASMAEDPGQRMAKAREFLGDISWDKTFNSMAELIRDVVAKDRSSEARAVSV